MTNDGWSIELLIAPCACPASRQSGYFALMMVVDGTGRVLIDWRLRPRLLVIQGGRICPLISTIAVSFFRYIVSGTRTSTNNGKLPAAWLD